MPALSLNKRPLRARLVYCYGDYTIYMGIRITITSNTRSWNGISITVHLFGDNIGTENDKTVESNHI